MPGSVDTETRAPHFGDRCHARAGPQLPARAADELGKRRADLAVVDDAGSRQEQRRQSR